MVCIGFSDPCFANTALDVYICHKLFSSKHVQMWIGWRICGALVQFGCYQHKYEWKGLWCSSTVRLLSTQTWVNAKALSIIIRISLEVSCTVLFCVARAIELHVHGALSMMISWTTLTHLLVWVHVIHACATSYCGWCRFRVCVRVCFLPMVKGGPLLSLVVCAVGWPAGAWGRWARW